MKITKRSIQYFTLLKLPLVYFSGIRITNISANGVEASVKLKWINQNPFRSMFWAVQGMAAELTSGVLLMREIETRKSSVSMLLVEAKASFSKKAKGKIRFSCDEVKYAKDLIDKAVSSGDGQRYWFTSIGIDENGDEVSRFQFHWSVKSKSR
jgi:hypothetical protein